MRRLPAFVLGVLVGGSVLGSLSLVHAQGAAPARAPVNQPAAVGRYMISASDGEKIFFVDTQTGEMWFRAVRGDWEPITRPPMKEAPGAAK